jgi:hypothetical protein
MSLPRQRRRHPAAAPEGATGATELPVAGTCDVEAASELVEATATRDVVASNVEACKGAEDGRVFVGGARDVSVAIPAPLHDESGEASDKAEFKESSARAPGRKITSALTIDR